MDTHASALGLPIITRLHNKPNTTPEHDIEQVTTLNMCKEADRLKTFCRWPEGNRLVTPHDLAKSGFYYLGHEDHVRCFSCKNKLSDWEPEDTADGEHRKNFSVCRVVRGVEARNIPLAIDDPGFIPDSLDIIGPDAPTGLFKQKLLDQFPCSNPAYPEMADESDRANTFPEEWMSISNPYFPAGQMAKAGFIYRPGATVFKKIAKPEKPVEKLSDDTKEFPLQDSDNCPSVDTGKAPYKYLLKCWYCDGGIANFGPYEEPWATHAKHFPLCEFVIQKMGYFFVSKVLEDYPGFERRGQTEQEKERSKHVVEQCTELIEHHPELVAYHQPPSTSAER